jgi:hypothetical protein
MTHMSDSLLLMFVACLPPFCLRTKNSKKSHESYTYFSIDLSRFTRVQPVKFSCAGVSCSVSMSEA